MLIANRNGMAVPKPLPYDAEVEYLMSSGTQYIDTGVHATQNTTAKIKCAWMTTTNDVAVFGADNGNTWTGFLLVQNTGIRFVKGGPTNTFAQRWNRFYAGMMYDIECSQNGVVIDGTLYSFNGTPTSEFYVNKPISLFGWWRNTQPWGSNVKIAYVQFFENGSLVRDFIPVRYTNSNGQSEGAMYDRVSKQLFRNQGTGSFVIGPDTKPISARSYVNDGLIAMWDGIENAGWGVHDPNATVWTDLVSGLKIGLPSGSSFETNRVSFDTVTSETVTDATSYLSGFATSSSLTAEWVMSSSGTANKQVFNITSGSGTQAYLVSDLFINSKNMTVYAAHTFNTAYWSRAQHTVSDGAVITMCDTWTSGQNEVVYFNGVQTLSASAFDSTPPYSGWYVHLGGGHYARANGAKAYCLRLYSRALSASEIAANYAIDKARFNLP